MRWLSFIGAEKVAWIAYPLMPKAIELVWSKLYVKDCRLLQRHPKTFFIEDIDQV